MWAEIKEKAKGLLSKWWVALVGFIAAGVFLLFGQKPRWVKHKEREIKQRDKAIERIKDEREKLKDKADEIKSSLPEFDKVVKEQDEKIAAAGKVEKPEPLTDASDIADFIKDRSRRK